MGGMKLGLIAVAMAMVLVLPCLARAGEPRILVCGDCWMQKAVEWGSFDAYLREHGFEAYETRGALTSVRGLNADWAASPTRNIPTSNKPFLTTVDEELAAYPTIDIVHLVLGANDFYNPVLFGANYKTFTSEEWDAYVATVRKSFDTIVRHMVERHPNVKVCISGYTYFDTSLIPLAGGSNFNGMTQGEVNRFMATMMDVQRQVAAEVDRVDYVQNWGILQYEAGVPDRHAPKEVPFPGKAFDYTPYPGGDPECGEPPSMYDQKDGMHPTDEAQRIVFDNCFAQFYKAWLTDTEPPSVVSINRAGGADEEAADPALTFEVTFSEPVRSPDVTPARFAVTTTPPGAFPDARVTAVSGHGAAYAVTVDAGAGTGAVRLDLADATGVRDITYHPLKSSFSNGESYSIRTPGGEANSRKP
ncbi:MAG: hypothetical protein QG656_1841 [Candidatus Hydrogenedentes bacterium]|nr:hypothetical protein [Candidatus Hydrogenedentota bacterium]